MKSGWYETLRQDDYGSGWFQDRLRADAKYETDRTDRTWNKKKEKQTRDRRRESEGETKHRDENKRETGSQITYHFKRQDENQEREPTRLRRITMVDG